MARTTTSDSGTDDKYKRAAPLNMEKLNLQPCDPDAAKIFKLCKLKFEKCTRALEATEDEKFSLLINRMDLSAYEFIDTTTSYAEAMEKLEKVFDKKVNKMYARWKLTNEKQQGGESLDSFQLRLMIIAKDCRFGDVTAVEYKNEAVLQSFVSG